MDYNIYVGLGGSFGGPRYVGTLFDVTEIEAEEIAREMAEEEYESNTFYDGVLSYDEVESNMLEEDPECSPEDIMVAYQEEVETWIEYKVVPKEKDDETQEDEIEYIN